jgi:hypothetical protein
VNEVLAPIKISQVYRALGGPELRRGGHDHYRGRAWWRDGDGLSISLDDARGVWYDHRDGEGGGILDLVIHVHGGTRAEALHYVAGIAGVALDDTPFSAADRARWVKQQRQIERELPKARLWLRSALALGEEVLADLKAPLADQTLPWPPIGEIARWTALLEAWHRLDGAGLVAEYRAWTKHNPVLTSAMVHVARMYEEAEVRALRAYLNMMATGEEVDAA